MLNIKVLGPGCPNCAKVEAVAKKAVAKAGVEAEIEKITDFMEIMNYDVLSTPGLVINEQLVSAGRIPSEREITAWLSNAIAASG
jgi:small redox-active disulfide protein 2